MMNYKTIHVCKWSAVLCSHLFRLLSGRAVTRVWKTRKGVESMCRRRSAGESKWVRLGEWERMNMAAWGRGADLTCMNSWIREPSVTPQPVHGGSVLKNVQGRWGRRVHVCARVHTHTVSRREREKVLIQMCVASIKNAVKIKSHLSSRSFHAVIVTVRLMFRQQGRLLHPPIHPPHTPPLPPPRRQSA